MKGTGDGEAKGAAPGTPQTQWQENQHYPNVFCDPLAGILPATRVFHFVLSGKEILLQQNNPGKRGNDNKKKGSLIFAMFFIPSKR